MEKFYITTAIPYPNGQPHVGFALEIIQADVLARYHRQLGHDVFFVTGVDEHGLKVYRSAQKEGVDFQTYVDRNSEEFRELKEVLNISYDDFIRTTDQKRHWPGAQKLWLENIEDIFEKEYSGLYCVGCEAFITEKELINGKCLEHGIAPELIKEKNYFFRLSKYKDEIKKLIESDVLKIIPVSRKNELLNILKNSEDFSISRPKEKLSWGVPVPNDSEQVQYVWYDALVNYATAIGYGRDEELFKKWWPADVHLIGKGILRFHAIYWVAMLLAAKLPVPKSILVHGYVSIEGEKISKSIGNVISPKTVVEKYGTDALRYFLIREIPTSEDGDFSEAKLVDRYNGDLANNLGNLVSRVAKLVETKCGGGLNREEKCLNPVVIEKINCATSDVAQLINDFRLHEALAEIFALFSFANEYINNPTPLASKDPAHINETLINLGELLICGNQLLWPFLPQTSEKIASVLGQEGVSNHWSKITIVSSTPLFPRI